MGWDCVDSTDSSFMKLQGRSRCNVRKDDDHYMSHGHTSIIPATRIPNVCKIIAFWALCRGLVPSFYIGSLVPI